MGGLFQHWQPRYAERNVATFPVRDKRPCIRGYLKLGIPASEQLAIKFPAEDAFGLACRRNRITVVDVDTPDERLLADALSEFGPTPFLVRSGSGNFQAWYRNNGESRKVRPDPQRPIDILGDGYVVAPPSRGATGIYEIIGGSLDDLDTLPTMRRPNVRANATPAALPERIDKGRRNQALWRECMRLARGCRDVAELVKEAARMNATMFYEPLPDEEVLRVVASAWIKEVSGENWFGSRGRVVLDVTEVDELLKSDPDAFILLTILRRRNWGNSEFMVANAMAETMPGGGWRTKRFAAARRRLEQIGEIEMIRPPSSYHGAAIYRFKGGQI